MLEIMFSEKAKKLSTSKNKGQATARIGTESRFSPLAFAGFLHLAG